MHLEIIKDVYENKKIKNIFSRHGNAAEHNFYHYINMSATCGACTFAVSDDNGIMGFEHDDTSWCYSDPLATEGEKLKLFVEYVIFCFKSGKEKVRSEISETLWQKVTHLIETRHENLRSIKPSYVYYWPIYDLVQWDPLVPGIDLKKIRNVKNRFYKSHKIEVIGKDQVSKEEILSLIEKWKAMRAGTDHTKTDHYTSAVNNDFTGYDSVRFITVDGIIGAMNGGWKIPNTDTFYSQLGIINYDIEDMGELSYLEDLNFLKQAGYKMADFGGSTPAMLTFKKKFLPSRIYKTVEFSIVQADAN